MNDDSTFTRRNAVKAIGATGALALGGYALTGGGAASNIQVTSNDVVVTNDTGDLEHVDIGPDFRVEWENFDEPVGKVRVLIEAARNGQEYDSDLPDGPHNYVPVFRATPWINGDPQEGGNQPITTGFYDNPEQWPVALFLENYQRPGYNATEDTSIESHWDGTNVGDNAGDYINGMYGAVGPTSPFEEADDGSTNSTKVHLRYTFSLHAMEGTSPLVMYDEHGAPFGDNPADAIPYRTLQSNQQHPAINVAETDFMVDVTNEPAGQGADGESNTGGGGDDVQESTPTPTPDPE